MDIWKWTEPSDEEFDKRRLEETHYRIYHKDADGKAAVDYKFWAKDDKEALETLNRFKGDHGEGGVEYFYSTSGYYVDSVSRVKVCPRAQKEPSAAIDGGNQIVFPLKSST